MPKKEEKTEKKKDPSTNRDLKNVEAKLKRVREHYEKNKQDKRAKREVDRIAQQLRKMKKYLGI